MWVCVGGGWPVLLLLVAVVVTVVVVGLFYLGWVLRFVNMVGCCGFFFLFIFKVALVDVGLCQWWLAGVVAIGGRCCSNGGCAVVVVDGDDRER